MFKVAEIGSNHGGDVAEAERLIQQAAEAGFDAVKFQIYHPVDVQEHAAPGLSNGSIRIEDLPRLAKMASRCWVRLGASIFGEWLCTSHGGSLVSFCDFFKVSAYDSNRDTLLASVIGLGKPTIVSVRTAAQAQELGGVFIPILAVSKYPADPQEYLKLQTYWEEFHGLSDHTADPTFLQYYCSVAPKVDYLELHVKGNNTPAYLPDAGKHSWDITDPEKMRTFLGRLERLRRYNGAIEEPLFAPPIRKDSWLPSNG